MNLIGGRIARGSSLRFGWVKVHVGVEGSEWADAMAKAGCRGSLLPQISEGGVRAFWKALRAGERAQTGLGAGRVVHWKRRGVLRYTQLRVGKGDVGQWRRTRGRGEYLCRLCGVEEETGNHLVLACGEVDGFHGWGWWWWSCEEMDDRKRWRYIEEVDGKQVVRSRVEGFFLNLDRVLGGWGKSPLGGEGSSKFSLCIFLCLPPYYKKKKRKLPDA